MLDEETKKMIQIYNIHSHEAFSKNLVGKIEH